MMSTEFEIVDLTGIVGEMDLACDYSHFECCRQQHANWIARLKVCACGVGGVRLICSDCKNYIMLTEEAAECGRCGFVDAPFRTAFKSFEPLESK